MVELYEKSVNLTGYVMCDRRIKPTTVVQLTAVADDAARRVMVPLGVLSYLLKA